MLLDHNNHAIIRRLLLGLGGLLVAGSLIIAFHLKDPRLMAYRQFEVPFLLLLTSSLIACYFYCTQGKQRLLALTLLLVTLLMVLYTEGTFLYRKNEVLNSEIHVPNYLGERFIIGYGEIEALKPLVSKGLIGGIFIARHNVVNKSIEQLRSEIAELQALRTAAGLQPLIVATTQEGGIASYLSLPLESWSSLATLAELYLPKAQTLAFAAGLGERQGKELFDIGVTVNFSPVVDIKNSERDSPLFNSLNNQRAISDSTQLTTEIAEIYAKGLSREGVRATLQHFPGLDNISTDSHSASARLETPVAKLSTYDWLPFQQVAKNTDALIMLGHVKLSAVDDDNPVSSSKAVVQDIIRHGWQHQGILITDDLTMTPAYRTGLCHATINALNAGVDLLLISYDYEKFYEAMYCAERAYRSGLLDQTMINDSHQRLSTLFL